MNTQENDVQEKKNPKKYSIHQKINPRVLGIEIFNQNIAVPYNAYLVCKLIYKEDIQSFKEIEEIIFEIQNFWKDKYQDIFVKQIHIFTSEKNIILTFSLGFFQKDQAKQLPNIREWVRDKIENHTNEVSQNELLKKIVTQIDQLENKLDKVEKRIKKKETMVIDSTNKEQKEVKQINQMVVNKIAQKDETLETEYKNTVDKQNLKKSINKQEDNLATQINMHKHEKGYNFHLVRGKKVSTQWVPLSPNLKDMQIESSNKPDEVKQKSHLFEYEKKIIYYFMEVQESEKKQIIPRKKFLEWRDKIEYIDYLWKMFESERQSELVIAEKLSCKNLIKELSVTLIAVEELSKSTKLFNYWIYCPRKVLVKLKGYVVLAEYLASIVDNTETVFMVS